MRERFDEMVKVLVEAGDISVRYHKDDSIEVQVHDFDGFDDDWDEIWRDFVEYDLMEQFLDLCDEMSDVVAVYRDSDDI